MNIFISLLCFSAVIASVSVVSSDLVCENSLNGLRTTCSISNGMHTVSCNAVLPYEDFGYTHCDIIFDSILYDCFAEDYIGYKKCGITGNGTEIICSKFGCYTTLIDE